VGNRAKAVFNVKKSLRANIKRMIPCLLRPLSGPVCDGSLIRMDRETLHDMRVSSKPARYVAELLAYLNAAQADAYVSEINALVRLLGEIHDYDVCLERMTECIEEISIYNAAVRGKDRAISVSAMEASVVGMTQRREQCFAQLTAQLAAWVRHKKTDKLCASISEKE
jgi:CHAD domain-containing protein